MFKYNIYFNINSIGEYIFIHNCKNGKKNKRIEYGVTAHNRSVYASPPYGGSGCGFARSFA
jgi:hypothetical protein